MKLLALGASTRKDSLNAGLAAIAAEEMKKLGAGVTLLDYHDYDAPAFHDEQFDAAHLPPAIVKLAALLQTHDGMLLASPEYNWSVPGALKNLIDWLSRLSPCPLTGKKFFLLCATPSKRGGLMGLSHLRTALESTGAEVMPFLYTIGPVYSLKATGDMPEDMLALLKAKLMLFSAFAKRA